MLADDYAIRIIQTDGASPNFSIDHDLKTVLYIYDGDLAGLVLMAQRAGEDIAKLGRIPLITAPVE